MKALITGASSGIGEYISKLLAQYNYDLIVVSRDKNKLMTIYNDYKVEVQCIELDLSKEKNCYKLYDMVKDEKIDILINDAGFGDAGYFVNTSLKKELNMIDLNIKAYHILTKLFLKDFVKRDYGRILNISSMAGFMPGPNMATYYATKNYITSLTLAISEELQELNSNVHISVLCPGPVKTNFEKAASVKFKIKEVSPKYIATKAVEEMFNNKLLIIPNNMKINYILIKLIPNKIIMAINSLIQERVK